MKNGKDKSDQLKDFKRIIVPIDGSAGSKRALKKALSLAKETDVDVLAMHVMEMPYSAIPDMNYSYPEVWGAIKKRGHTLLDNVKNTGSKMGVHVDTKLVEGIPDDEIIKEARKNDLIIMGCKGRTALSRIFIGSVCEKVLHHSTSPVMIIR